MLQTTAFRLSTYLTLGIACAALGYAESALLPEVGVFAVVVLIALAVIYRLETRVRLLSIPEANRLGAGIGLGTLLWAGFRIVRELNVGEFATLGWPVFIVSLIAPLLLATVCAKLLRREKHAGDYWFIHAAGLAAIVLAGAMAEQSLLAALTAAYAFCAVWSLFLFFLARASGAVPSIPARTAACGFAMGTFAFRSADDSGSTGGGRSGFAAAVRWFVVGAAAVVPLYLLTPRSTFGKLDFGQPRIEIGYAADQMIDLTQTGDLRENPETAFEVVATDSAGRPKEDLNPEQRWRGAVLVTYSKGSWKRDSLRFPTEPGTIPTAGPWIPPKFGATGYRLIFTVPKKLRSEFLADPVMWLPGEHSSVANLPAGGPPQAWTPIYNGSVFFRTANLTAAGSELRYVQYTRPPSEKDLSPPYYGIWGVPRAMTTNTIASVRDYADKVLAEMVNAGRLPPAVQSRDAVNLLPAELYHEAIARAFRDHLSERPDLVYTTALKRENKTVDPVEDFLFYSKAGHCERFASALVLMLRSQGIPAVMVLGFKGCEHTGGGHYVVRQEFAHAWAEALIARPGPLGNPRVWYSLSLDPSPVQAAETGDSGDALSRSRAAFERFLFHYTPEQRDRAIRAILDGLTSMELPIGGAVLAMAIPLVRLLRRRVRRSRTAAAPRAAAWFERLLGVLAPYGLKPVPGETPREFAHSAAAALAARPETAILADVPVEWVEAHYSQRFGGVAISEERKAELDARAIELAARHIPVRLGSSDTDI